jgi:excisionase family DNA binding protein
MDSPLKAPSLISVADAARRLSISLRSLRTLIALGRLPTVRVTERRVAIAEDDLAAFVEQRREPVRKR